MCVIFLILLTVFSIIEISVQQCNYSCYANTTNTNCTNSTINANTSIISQQNGVVKFEFELKCNIKKYKIQLFTNNNNKEPHSEYTYSIVNKKINVCNKTATIFLQNIKTGCYKILVIDDKLYFIYNKTHCFTTSYIEKKFNIFETVTSYSYRSNGTELKFHIENPILPQFSLVILCKKCDNNTEYNLIRDDYNRNKYILDPNNIKNDLNISCLRDKRAKLEAVDCIIFPVSIGAYEITIIFYNYGNICPLNVLRDNRIKVGNIFVKGDDDIILEHMKTQQFGNVFGIILGVFCSLTAFYILLKILKLIKLNANKLQQNAELIHEVKIEDETSCSNLLLLYPRSPENIMKTLTSFRNIFTHAGINVYDIYDPDHFKQINELNYSWILNLTNRGDVKILLFLTDAGENLSQLQMQESVDALYPFAIKQLLNQISNDCEFSKRIYVAYFDNDHNKYTDYLMFAPHLRYTMPLNIKALLEHILNKDNVLFNNKMNNEFNKFLENYELLTGKRHYMSIQ